MQCIICGAYVAEPSKDMKFPQDKSGLCGNFLYSNRNGRTIILNAYCDSHIETARNLFSSVNGKNYADSWDTFDSNKYTWATLDSSSAIKRYAYFEQQQALAVELTGDASTYVYWDVLKEDITGLETSLFPDLYFLSKIQRINNGPRPHITFKSELDF